MLNLPAPKPPEELVPASESRLAVLPPDEAEASETAVDTINTGDPPPIEETETARNSEGWGPLRIDDPPSVEPFPLDVLPPAVAKLVSEAARSIGCPPDFIAVPCLAVAGGVIGRSVSLELKDGYRASSTIWAASVGIPSDGKSPSLAIASEPLRRIDRILQDRHEAAKDQWADECREKASNGEKPPEPPKLQRIDIDDATWESLVNVLSDNPRGLVMVHDELAILLSGMNQYKSGKGTDRQTACKIWSGAPIKRDRVSNANREPIRCPYPSLSIVGALTPDMLGEMIDAKGREDGFVDRFLFTYPNALPSPEWSHDGVPGHVADGWAAIVIRLWERPLAVKEGRPGPHVTTMTERGVAAWTFRFNKHQNEMNDPGFPPPLRSPWGKFRDYAGRLALILALLDHAADPPADAPISRGSVKRGMVFSDPPPRPTAAASVVPNVDERHVENAWRLVAYFKSHAKRAHAVARLGVSGPEAAAVKAIVVWLRDKPRETFTERDLKRARPWIESDTLKNALCYLERANAIRKRESPQATAGPGRPKSPIHEVNPALYP